MSFSLAQKYWCCDDASLTADGKRFHTVGMEMQKARAVVTGLVGGTVSSVEFEHRERAG